jgi:hypothetical protein
MTRIFMMIVLALPVFPQAVTSVTCWGAGGTSCYQMLSSTFSGSISCLCAASCSNSNNISASYGVWWACTDWPSTGIVSGGSVGWGVRVDGSLSPGGAGYEWQNCSGVTDSQGFSDPC